MGPLQQGSVLRHFLAVANERSVSAAARVLAISQPALTRSIRRLESDLGVALFERLPRGMALTPYGEVLHRHAQRIATEVQFAEAEMAAFREGHVGRLRVGAGPFWGATLVPVAIARMQQRFPKLAIHLDVGVNHVILPRLYDGDLDVMFGAIPPAADIPAYILRREYLANDIRVACGAHHPLLTRSRVTPSDLAPYPWVIYQQDREAIGRLLEAMQAGGGAPPSIRVESTSMSALIRLLKAGTYLACVSEAFINAQPDLGIRIVPVPLAIWRFQTGVLLHRSLEHYAPVVALAESVRDAVASLPTSGSRARSPRPPSRPPREIPA